MPKTYPIRDVKSDRYLNPPAPETRRVGSITKIIIHHNAVVRRHDYDTMALLRAEAAGHYNRLGPGLQYHYTIDNVGDIYWVRDHTKTLWHASNLAVNRSSIAISLDGYFHPPHNQKPTREQYEALKQLLNKLSTKHPEFPADFNDVFGHREVAQAGFGTACPGDGFAPWVKSYRTSLGKIAIPTTAKYDWPTLQPATYSVAAPKPAAPTMIVSYRVVKGGTQLGAYTIDTNAWNKYKSTPGSVIQDAQGNDVTAQLIAKFNPPTPPPAVPNPGIDPAKVDPIPVNTSIQDLKTRVGALEAIINKLRGLFNG